MGYLDNSSITVDAILTKKGRELMAKGKDFFVVSQFALSDDEIDYNLWNPAHPLGSDFYGIIIENMPIVEAVSDENYSLKYKLLTLPQNTTTIPVVTVNPTFIELDDTGQIQTITVSTQGGGNELLGYTATLLNSDAATIVGNTGAIGNTTDPVLPNEGTRTVTVVGKDQFTITTKNLVGTQDLTTKIIIVGNETGGVVEVDLTVINTD
jgi:hypothetical protein